MKPESFLDGRVILRCGDCLDVLAGLGENSIDAVVTDPPYHLASIVKRFGADDAAPAKPGKTGAYERASRGFLGNTWDGGDIAFRPETWAAVMRVLKPGGHLVAFGATKNSHRLTCAIEDGGFEIRDMIAWLFGSGFPKSHDVSKGIDRMAGAERDLIATGRPVKRMIPGADQNKAGWEKNNGREYVPVVSASATPAAQEWEGWGTALKPAIEPITLARKPLSEGTIAANVLRWRTGALNIDGCRVASADENPSIARRNGAINHLSGRPAAETEAEGKLASRQSPEAYRAKRDGEELGRWPANVCHDGSSEVIEAFPAEAGAFAPVSGTEPSNSTVNVYGARDRTATQHHGDSGSAARFFYNPKADAGDRIGSKHPTVKPIDLMRWLVRLVTPPGGTVIDPFSGTGTTGEAAWLEGCSAVLIEREAEYQADIRRRMKLCLAGPDEKARESIKAKTAGKPIDAGPLFGGADTFNP